VADIASDVGIFMQNVRTRQSTGSMAGVAGCAQSVDALGLILIWLGAIQKKSLSMRIGVWGEKAGVGTTTGCWFR